MLKLSACIHSHIHKRYLIALKRIQLNNYRMNDCSSFRQSIINADNLSDNRKTAYSSRASYSDNMEVPPEGAFQGLKDRFGGVTVDTTMDKFNADIFSDKLTKSLDFWYKSKCRTIWFKVSVANSTIVPILAENGFNFHHAREGFVMMYKWLPTDVEPNIPVYAHTMVGVGGLVISDDNKILTIVEKQSILPGHWKLPGGYVEPNETFVDAAIREVQEETGIRTKYDRLICIRHAKGFNFGCSDLYIVLALKPVTESEEITACPREIQESKWMDFDEYLNHPKVHDLNRNFLRMYLRYKEEGIKIDCKEEVHQLIKRKYMIYFASPKM